MTIPSTSTPSPSAYIRVAHDGAETLDFTPLVHQLSDRAVSSRYQASKSTAAPKYYEDGQIQTMTNRPKGWSDVSLKLMGRGEAGGLCGLAFNEYFTGEKQAQIASLLKEFGYQHTTDDAWRYAVDLVLAGIQIGERMRALSAQGVKLAFNFDMDDTHLDFFWPKPFRMLGLFGLGDANKSLPFAYQLRPTCEVLLGMRLILDDTLFTGTGPQVNMFTNSNPTKMSTVFDSAMMQAIWLSREGWQNGDSAVSPKELQQERRVITITDNFTALRVLMTLFYEMGYDLHKFTPAEQRIISFMLEEPDEDHMKFPSLSKFMDADYVRAFIEANYTVAMKAKSAVIKSLLPRIEKLNKNSFDEANSFLVDDNPKNYLPIYGVGSWGGFVPTEAQNKVYKYASGDGTFENRRNGHGVVVPLIFGILDHIDAQEEAIQIEGRSPESIVYQRRRAQNEGFANDDGTPFRIFNMDSYPKMPDGYVNYRWYNPEQPKDGVAKLKTEFQDFKSSNADLYGAMAKDMKTRKPQMAELAEEIYKDRFYRELNYVQGAPYVKPMQSDEAFQADLAANGIDEAGQAGALAVRDRLPSSAHWNAP
jgi:hypothetical protein